MKSNLANFPEYSDAKMAGDESFVRVTKQKEISEREFSRWVAKNYLNFVTRVEPGLGGDVGAPDLFILSDGLGGLLGVELKKSKIVGGTLYPSEVRPAQIQWHNRLNQSGGVSLFLCHAGADGIWGFNSLFANQWEDGFSITGQGADGAYQIDEKNFTQSLENFIEEVICV